MAINETITVEAGGAVGAVKAVGDAFAEAASKAMEAIGKINSALDSVGKGGSAAAGADKLAASMDAAAAKIAEAASKAEASLGKIGGAADAAAGGVDRMGAAADAAAGGLKDASLSADEAASASDRLAGAADAAGGALDKQAVAGDRAAVSSKEGAAGAGSFWGGLKTVLLGAGVAAAYGIDKAMKFQSQMLLLHTQAGVSVKDTQAMSQGVLQISTQTGQALPALAESAYHVASNMASMGATVPQMLGAVKIAAEGAAVGHSNLVDTTNAMTAAIASGIPGVSNYSQAMGVLNATVGSGDMSMQDLAEAFGGGMVATVKGYGLTLKDVGAATAVFGDNNIRGAKAGTDLRMAVQALAVPMKTAPLEKFGLAQDTLAKDMQKGGLTKALDDLTGRFKTAGLTGKTEGEWITALFGKKAGSGIAVLLEQMDRYHSKLPLLTKDANSFNAAWQATQATPQQKWKEMTAGFQALAVNFGTTLLPSFGAVAGVIDGVLAKLNSSKGAVKDIAIGLGGLGALFTAKKLFGGVESALGTAGKIGTTLKIPGLDKLGNVGKGTASAEMAGAAATQESAAKTMAGAAAAQESAAKTMAEAAGAGDLGKGGTLPGSAARAEQTATRAEQAATTGAEAGVGGSFLTKLIGKGGPTAGLRELAGGMVWPMTIAMTTRAIGDTIAPAGSNAGVASRALQQSSMAGPSGAGTIGGFEGWLATSKFGNAMANFFSGVPGTPTVAGGSRMTGLIGQLPYGPPPKMPLPPPVAGPPLTGSALTSLIHPLNAKLPDLKAKVTVDTSSIAQGAAKVTAAMAAIGKNMANIKPAKIPEPDTSALGAAKAKVTGQMAGITGAMRAAAGPAQAAGAAVSQGLAAGIASAGAAAIAAARHVASAVAAAMSSALQTRSPSKVTEAIGAFASEGLAVGLHRKKHVVKAAAMSITASAVSSLVTGLQGGQSAVDAAMAALGSVAKPQDISAIESTVAKLQTQLNTALMKKIISKPEDSALTKFLRADQAKLEALAARRTVLETEISNAQQITSGAVSNASIMNAQGATPPGATPAASSYELITGMQYQADQAKQFAADVAKLRKQGLNATSLNQIIQAGAASGEPVAQGIEGGGKAAITQLNQLQQQIQKSANSLGNTGGPVMYQAGVDVGKGAANGLKSQLSQVNSQMKAVGQAMVSAVSAAVGGKADAAMRAAGASIGKGMADGMMSEVGAVKAAAAALAAAAEAAAKTRLQSSSPSRLFWGIGYGTGQGMARGIDAGSALAGAAAGRMAQRTAAGYAHAGTPPGYTHGGGSGGGNTVIHVHVAGNVTAENDLATTIQGIVLTRGANNWQQGWRYPGRAA